MIDEPVLLDAGPLVAMLSTRDVNRVRCAAQAEEIVSTTWTCWPVLTEAAYLLRTRLSAIDGLIDGIVAAEIRILPLDETDLPGIRANLHRFHDQGFDFADACLMHLAEREGIRHVFTLDRRHFGVFRTTAGEALIVLPDGA